MVWYSHLFQNFPQFIVIHTIKGFGIVNKTEIGVFWNSQYWMLGAGALGRPRGMEWEGRREEGSGWGTHVYLWWIHFDIWQNQYNFVKLKNKIKLI